MPTNQRVRRTPPRLFDGGYQEFPLTMSTSGQSKSKSKKFVELLKRPPAEIVERVRNWAEGRFDTFGSVERPAALSLPKLLVKLGEVLPNYIPGQFDEEIALLRRELADRQEAVALGENLGLFHDGSPILGELLYSVTRALRPRVVVETGVAHGVTSCHILSALARNGLGTLDSIDLPPLVDKEVENTVGVLVPHHLRERWTLHRGTSRNLLVPLCERLRGLNLFIHDSLHTRATMLFEFQVALKYMARPAAIVSDDIGMNGAFRRLIEISKPTFSAEVRRAEGGEGQVGICVFL